MENSEQVILSEMGHVRDVKTPQLEAFGHLPTHFYDTGEVDDSLFVYQPMDFHVRFGFPVLAKIGLAVVVLVIGGLVVFVRFVVRRV